MLGDVIGIELKVAVDENVSEASEPLQACAQLFVDDGVRGQLGDDIFVVAGALAEVRAQNVIAGVEQDLGGELKSALGRPRVAKVGAQKGTIATAKLLEYATRSGFAKSSQWSFRATSRTDHT